MHMMYVGMQALMVANQSLDLSISQSVNLVHKQADKAKTSNNNSNYCQSLSTKNPHRHTFSLVC